MHTHNTADTKVKPIRALIALVILFSFAVSHASAQVVMAAPRMALPQQARVLARPSRAPAAKTDLSFQKLAPPNGASDMPTHTVQLTWSPYNAANVRYRLCVNGPASAGGNLPCNVANVTETVQTAYTLTHLLPASLYHWQVFAHISTTTVISADIGVEFAFTTVATLPSPQAPGQFSKLTPPNNATNVPTPSVTLTWQPSAGAVFYRVCLRPNSATSIECDLSPITTTDTSVVVENLLPRLLYAWTVTAVNDAGVTPADSGARWYFTTVGSNVPARPGPFSKLAPVDGATGLPLSGVILSWQPAANADGYKVCLGLSNAPCNLLLVTGAISLQVPITLQPGMTYTWQVMAFNGAGTTDASNPPWRFRTAGAPPGLPGPFARLTPPDGSVDVPARGFTLTWESAAGANEYKVCIGLARGTTPIGGANPTACNFIFATRDTRFSNATLQLLPGTAYRWQVYALSASGNTPATGGF
jgi:hypothetical protein